MSEIKRENDAAQMVTPDVFSERVLMRSVQTQETILESMTALCDELDIDEVRVKKMLTPPLLSRLTAECQDAGLLKDKIRSKKLV